MEDLNIYFWVIQLELITSKLCVSFQVFDQCAISDPVKDEVYKFYPSAKRAHLKTGGNFPYLCRSAEVNLHIQVCFGIIQAFCFSVILHCFAP